MEEIINKLSPFLREVWEHLHDHPELSFEEYETTSYIESLLKKYPCSIKTFNDSTGLVVDIGSGSPVVALRADIDALWQEVDGEFKANHSCGHDAHMTIAIGVFLTLLEGGLPEKGTFRFIFQPGEEKGKGALSLVEKGIVDDVDFLYGMHLRPSEELRNGQFAPAIRHGAAKFIKGKIIGDDAHGARPHLNANAIQVGMELYQHISNIQVDPRTSHSAKLTAFHAGSKSANIIPGNATFSIDLRAQSNEVIKLLSNKIKQITAMLASYHEVNIELEVSSSVAAAVLDSDAVHLMENGIIKSVGKENLAPIITTTGGDDFHFYTIKRPDLKATMLAIGCDLKPGLHHPHMTFNHDSIPKAVEILAKVLIDTAKGMVEKR
ncbi:M20 peptidase aminoacylase family protein [Pseudogracilibacillus sp. SE30717A]|uniref:M20 peptidase aminoacylase family protein n=1 Tax=Pseudogracilibacillus sp. SE30717A TaxID=3098293 RepID=UPI00300E00F9